MKNVSSVCSECFLSLPNINTVFCLMNQMLINAKYISYFFCVFVVVVVSFLKSWSKDGSSRIHTKKNCLFNSTQKIISYFMIHIFFLGRRKGEHYLHKFNKYLCFFFGLYLKLYIEDSAGKKNIVFIKCVNSEAFLIL